MKNSKQKSKKPSLQDINKIFKEHKDELREKYKIKEIGVFGSYVRGEQKKRGSDVDILVRFDEEDIPSLLEFIAMERHLSRLIRNSTGKTEAWLEESTLLQPYLVGYFFTTSLYL